MNMERYKISTWYYVWYKKIWPFYWEFLGNVDGVEADRKEISVIHPLASTAVPPPPSLFLEAWEIPVSGNEKDKKYTEWNSTWGGHLVAACLLNCFLLPPVTFSSNWFLNAPGWQCLAFHITRLLLCFVLFFLFLYRSSLCLWDQPWLLHKSWPWSVTRCHHKGPQRLCAVELVISWSPNIPPASPPSSLSFQTNMSGQLCSNTLSLP